MIIIIIIIIIFELTAVLMPRRKEGNSISFQFA